MHLLSLFLNFTSNYRQKRNLRSKRTETWWQTFILATGLRRTQRWQLWIFTAHLTTQTRYLKAVEGQLFTEVGIESSMKHCGRCLFGPVSADQSGFFSGSFPTLQQSFQTETFNCDVWTVAWGSFDRERLHVTVRSSIQGFNICTFSCIFSANGRDKLSWDSWQLHFSHIQ